jgi:lipopolysaccharide biosynthesis regulator YciM
MTVDTTTVYAVLIVAVVLIAFVAWGIMRWRRTDAEPRRSSYVEGLTRLIDGDSNAAFELLQSAVRSGNAPADAYLRVGRMLRERGDANKALQIHRTLTVREDLTRREKADLFVDIAEDYSELGRPDQAVSVLDTAARKMGMREARIYRILARESHRLGKSDAAYDYLKELKKTGDIGERELALYLTTVGRTAVGSGNERDGRRTLQRAIKHDPQCGPAHMVLGDMADASGNTEEAIHSWREAARLSRELAPQALRNVERASFQLGTFSEMEKVYRDVLAARPDDEVAVMRLAAFFKKQGRGDEAINLLEGYRAEHPDAVTPMLLLTSIYATERGTDSLEQLLAERQERAGTTWYRCDQCQYETEEMRWHCPRCNAFDSFHKA